MPVHPSSDIKQHGLSPAWTRFHLYRLLCLLSLGLLTLVDGLSPPVFGAVGDDTSAGGNAWHIVADEVTYDDRTQVYSANGHVVIAKGHTRLAADVVVFDHRHLVVTAFGNVMLSAGQNVMTADHLTFDLKSETGVIHQGQFYIHKNNFHIQGDRIRKIDADTYVAAKASVTTCDGHPPAWKISGRNLKVTMEGYGYAYHSVFWVNNVPIFYSPFIAFPVKQERQSGFLIPQISYSDRKGMEYHQPFFVTLGDHADTTLYWHHMGLRGEKFGSAFRYAAGEGADGTVMADFLNDAKVDDGSGEWGYTDYGNDNQPLAQDLPRTRSDRYWIRAKVDQPLPVGFFARLDIDTLSDQDYLREFKSGYTGFDFTNDTFQDEFGRGLDDINDPIRLNRLNLQRQWADFSLNLEGRWYDDVIQRLHQSEDDTVQRLPFASFDAARQAFFQTPFYFDWQSEYSHFYRESASTDHQVTQNQRLDVYPRIYLPLRIGPYATFEPSAGYRKTVWHIDRVDADGDHRQEGSRRYRDLFDYRLQLSSELEKIFGSGRAAPADRLRHTVKPVLVYTYIPEKDQSAYPHFDAVDRIEAEQLITLSLTQLLIFKDLNRPVASAPGKANAEDVRYPQMLRWEIRQSYDLNEAQQDDPSKWRNQQSQEPFRPLFNYLSLTPQRYLHIETDSKWSFYDSTFVAFNTAINLFDARGDRLLVEHRFRKSGIDALYGEAVIQLNERLSTSAAYETDLYADRQLMTRFGMQYEAQCWSLDLSYTQEVDEDRYAFTLKLNGLGEI